MLENHNNSFKIDTHFSFQLHWTLVFILSYQQSESPATYSHPGNWIQYWTLLALNSLSMGFYCFCSVCLVPQLLCHWEQILGLICVSMSLILSYTLSQASVFPLSLSGFQVYVLVSIVTTWTRVLQTLILLFNWNIWPFDWSLSIPPHFYICFWFATVFFAAEFNSCKFHT